MKISQSILTLVLVCGIFACSKEKQSPGGNSGNGGGPGNEVAKSTHPNLQSFFAATATAPETHSVNATQFIQISTQAGTQFLLMPNSLVDMMGNAVTGNVDIKIKEYNTPEAMILGKVGTVLASGDLLESGGMFKIDVSQNGQPLRLKDGSQYAVKFPNNQPGMEGYIGTSGSDGTTQWVRKQDWIVEADSMKFNSMICDSFAFGNLDRLADMANRTELGVQFDASQKNEEMSLLLIFKNRRVVAYLPQTTPGNYETGSHYDVPQGEELTLVAYGYIDGYLYWYNKTITIGTNETIQLPVLEKISEADFKKKLKELNP